MHCNLVVGRGHASQGLWTLAGVINSDYRGSIEVILFKTYDEDWQEVEHLPSTNRGDGGLGSTGTA